MARAKKENKKLHYMPWRPESFYGSLTVIKLTRLAELTYRRLIDYSWMNTDKPGYLLYDEDTYEDLVAASQCKDKAEFLSHWEKIKTKFKIVKVRGKKFIYNPVTLATYHEVMKKVRSGRLGGKKRAANAAKAKHDKMKAGTWLPFSKSKYSKLEFFTKYITSHPPYADVNIDHYYKKITSWAAKKAPREDWGPAIDKFLSNAVEKNELVTNASLNGKENTSATKTGKKRRSAIDSARENAAAGMEALKAKHGDDTGN